MKSISERWNIKNFMIVLFLILLSSVMLFSGLDHWYLWQDEALAAMLAKNTLKWGVPYVFDGINVLWNHPVSVDPNSFYFVVYGWLPFYVNALIFYFFGITTFCARFSSAMAGCVFFVFMFFTLLRITESNKASLWAVLSMIFCVPLLLHFRQCHYYGLGILFTWGLFHSFLLGRNFLRNYIFYGFSLALVNTHLLEWGTLMVSFVLAALAIRDRRAERLKMLALNLIFCVPFLYLYQIVNFLGLKGHKSPPGLVLDIPQKIIFYFSHVELSLLPLGLMIVLLVFTALLWHRMREIEQTALVSGLLISFVTIFLTAVLMPFTYFRYIVMIIPLLESVLILGIWHSFRFSKILGFVFLLFSLLFQLAQFRKDSQGKYFSYLIPYLYELRNDGEDVNERLCHYLNQNANKTDTVFCMYEEYPLMFYTPLAVRGGEGKIGAFSEDFRNRIWGIEQVQKPDWIVFRRGWEFLYPEDYFKNLLSGSLYDKIVLPVEDTGWGNRPCPLYHYFTTPLVEHPLILYRRKLKT